MNRKCPCMAVDMGRVEVGVAEAEWAALGHNWSRNSSAATGKAASRLVESTVLWQEVVVLRDLLGIQVAAAPVVTVVALRAVPAADEARVAVRVWVGKLVEVAAAPVVTGAALRAVPVAAEGRVAPAAVVRVSPGTQDVEAVVVAAVLHPAIPVAVAGKAGPEAAVKVVPAVADTAVEAVAAVSHRAIPAVAVAGKVGQEAGATVGVRMQAVGPVEVVEVVELTRSVNSSGFCGVPDG
ncbi:MAG: hypothetical protein ISS70_13730 [Phycisphaerae bacterium]|nr:hypothetical protein [Phycisphaerae bacterium]